MYYLGTAVKMSLAVTSIAILFSGCVNPYQYQLTPEQQQQFLQSQQQAMQRLNKLYGGNMGGIAVQQEMKTEPQVPAISQDELKTKIESFGVSANTVVFERTKSGININGKAFNDYEGSIKEIGFDYVSGAVTYLAQTAPDTYVMKYIQATSDKEPLTVGNVKFIDGTWQVHTVTGKNLSGDSLVIGSTGFVMNRIDGSGFMYNHKTGIKSINVPSEYQIAKYQSGDVVETQTILLEIPNAKQGGVEDFFSKASALGSSLGINTKEDYAFFNIKTGKLTKINIPNDGKSQTKCIEYGKKINKFVSQCIRYASVEEALFDIKDGKKHLSHYFWRIRWFNTPEGVIAITQEDGLRKIFATNLTTGKKVIIAERALGFAGFEAFVDSNGKIGVMASKGVLGNDTIEDISELVKTLPAVVEKVETK